MASTRRRRVAGFKVSQRIEAVESFLNKTERIKMTPKLLQNLGCVMCGKTRPMLKRICVYECPVCKKAFKARASNVASGNTTKCMSCASRIKRTTHGESKTRIYSIWKGMLDRVDNPKNPNFHIYGGKGVKLYEPWRDVSVFKEWALENGYADWLTIDRIDGNGDYCPENCRWADGFTQSQNQVNYENPKKTSLYRGVSWDKKRKKWVAEIRFNNKRNHLGRFENEVDAALAYDLFIIKNKTEHPKNFTGSER